jgi:hypothetical protein
MMTATEAHTFLTSIYKTKPTDEQLHYCARGGLLDDVTPEMAEAAAIILQEQISAIFSLTGEEFVHYDTSKGPICTPKMPAWVLEEQEKAEARRLAKENARKAKAGVSRMTREEMAIEAENIAR